MQDSIASCRQWRSVCGNKPEHMQGKAVFDNRICKESALTDCSSVKGAIKRYADCFIKQQSGTCAESVL